jgi:hypothetical protein
MLNLTEKQLSQISRLGTGILFCLGFIGLSYFAFSQWGVSTIYIRLVSVLWLAFLFLSLYKTKAVLLLILLFILIRGLILPVSGWDTYSMYDARAKMFLKGATFVDFTGFSKFDISNSYYYLSYPPMTSNLHWWAYDLGLKTPMIVYSLFTISYLCLIFYWSSKFNLPPGLRIVLFVTCVFHDQIFRQYRAAYSNLPMLCFQMGALHFLLLSSRDKSLKNVLAASLMLIFSVWTRVTEPMFVAFALAFLVFNLITVKKISLLKNILYTAILIVPSFLVRNYWSKFVYMLIGNSTQTNLSIILDPNVIMESLSLDHLFQIAHFLWFAFTPFLIPILAFLFLFLLFCTRQLRFSSETLIISVLIICYLLLLAGGTWYLSTQYIWWNLIPDSLLRTGLFLVPAITFVVAAAIDQNKNHI